MEVFSFQQHPTFPWKTHFMSRVSSRFDPPLRLFFPKSSCLCASSPISETSRRSIRCADNKQGLPEDSARVKSKASSDVLLKEDWLRSLTSPFPEKSPLLSDSDTRPPRSYAGSEWVLGIDPDTSGAVAVLKPDDSGYSAQVFDSPYVNVPVGKRIRRRLDANSIVQLIQSLDAPIGTTAYVEQSIPYPQDGKQGWWSGGFGYGLWIGILVASGFSVVPVPSFVWKNEFKLAGNCSSKDGSRDLASTLFPSVSSLLKRKKDHGRAEALLIAAYGKGLKMGSYSSCVLEEFVTKSLLPVAAASNC